MNSFVFPNLMRSLDCSPVNARCSRLVYGTKVSVHACGTFGECCETVCEFFVRVLRSSGVILIVYVNDTNMLNCPWKVRPIYCSYNLPLQFYVTSCI